MMTDKNILSFIYLLINKNLNRIPDESNEYSFATNLTLRKRDELHLVIRKCGCNQDEIEKFLFTAVRTGKNIALKSILEIGININCCYDENGDTLLHWAVRKADTNIVAILLEYGIDPFLKNKLGFEAVVYSLKKPEIYSLFEQNYPLFNESFGSVCLMMYEQAIQVNNKACAQMFLALSKRLENETATRIVEQFQQDPRQEDKLEKPNIYSLFQQSAVLDKDSKSTPEMRKT